MSLLSVVTLVSVVLPVYRCIMRDVLQPSGEAQLLKILPHKLEHGAVVKNQTKLKRAPYS